MSILFIHTHQNDALGTHEDLIGKMGKNCLNLGVDNCEFKPLSWRDFKDKMTLRNRLFD